MLGCCCLFHRSPVVMCAFFHSLLALSVYGRSHHLMPQAEKGSSSNAEVEVQIQGYG